MSRPRVLFVFTSCNQTLTGGSTGWYLPEAAHPYYVLSPHADTTFAAPQGPFPPVDKSSVESYKDDESQGFLKDAAVTTKFENCLRLADVKAEDYDAVFYVGGHGPVIDLANDSANIKLAEGFLNGGKIISAVCHGPAALVGVKDASGKSIFEGKEATGFSNAEEEQAGTVKDVPFLLETRIKELGGTYTCAGPWAEKVVVAGNLITGQNPASAKPLGETLLKKLQV